MMEWRFRLPAKRRRKSLFSPTRMTAAAFVLWALFWAAILVLGIRSLSRGG